ncbi:MAG TPA: aminotransferase class V-fold PLP-dependent enzyme [Chthoniobacterales bacterium]
MKHPEKTYQPGRHFLQIPGPTNVPDRILRAMDRPTIDHRGPDFPPLAFACFDGLKAVFQMKRGHVFLYPGSGTGAWEAGIANTLSPGDRVLMFETGHFATLWRNLAVRFGLKVDFMPGDWRHGIDPALVQERLARDSAHEFKAVLCVHNETSTGVTSRIGEVRQVMDAVQHPALLMVDAVSSLGSIDYRHEEWQVDVTVAGSQKGLMLPPGLGLVAASEKALAASSHAALPRGFWAWDDVLEANRTGYFPYTPATNLMFGLQEAIAMLVQEEGLDRVFKRHERHGEATRAAVDAWGLQLVCADPREYSPSCTAILMPDGYDEAHFRSFVLENYNLSLGAGLSKLKGKAFRIGHLGDLNDLTLCGTLCGVEMGLAGFGVPSKSGGVDAAMAVLRQKA